MLNSDEISRTVFNSRQRAKTKRVHAHDLNQGQINKAANLCVV